MSDPTPVAAAAGSPEEQTVGEADDLSEELRDAECDHVGTGRITKFDGGRLPILCERCRTIVGWDR